MDVWEDDDAPGVTHNSHAEIEWQRIEEVFMNSGYREGITAGKEGALQEGFDDGFANVGVPLGERVGSLRGTAAGIQAFLRLQMLPSADPTLLAEVQAISRQLDNVRFNDIVPPDELAEAHAKEHEPEEVTAQAGDADVAMDDISAAFSSLATKDSASMKKRRREEALARLQELQERLSAVLQRLEIPLQL